MKNISKIIIFIICINLFLVALFIPSTAVKADQTGTCTTYTVGGGDMTQTTTTQANCTGTFTPNLSSGSATTNDTTNYQLLVPLPCPGGTSNCPTTDANGNQIYNTGPNANGKSTAIGLYLNIMMKIFIGLCAMMAVVMIVVGGMQYMTSELISNKEAAKSRIRDAILGLLIALCAWALLNQINPAILSNTDPGIAPIAISVPYLNTAQTAVNGMYGGYASGSSLVTDFPQNCPSGNLQTCLPTLPAGVQVCASNGQCGIGAQCTTVGQQNCTSTLGLNTSTINSIESGCTAQNGGTPCPITITAGTEFWLHGGATGNTSHQPGSSSIDLSATSSLNSYITGSSSFPAGNVISSNGICYYAEPAGATTSTTANHWHVYAPSSGTCSTIN